ncbi:MAG TPA: hypothetical protein VHI13_21350 [Candidatus Kapabacteria bacterium]|nr:hypothetical protein [Candidatus Kapabacteria bacterium]
MSGYFIRLAERSGLRLGGAPHAGSRATQHLPPPHPERPGPQPLEVEETRVAGSSDAVHSDDSRNAAPERGTERADGARRQGVEPGVRRIEVDVPHGSAAPFASARGDGMQPEPGDRPEPKPGAMGTESLRSMPGGSQGEAAGRSAVPVPDAAAERAPANRAAPVERGDMPGDAASLEEMVVRMIESDMAATPKADPPGGSADASPRVNNGTRQLLRDVIDWIAAPAEQQAGANPEPIEREAYRESGGHQRAEQASATHTGSLREEAGRDAVRSLAIERGDAMRGDARREPLVHERARERAGREMQESSPLESGSPNFTLSIGSIRIVIEEPAPVQPAQMQASRGDGHAREAKRTEGSRLSRYYL